MSARYITTTLPYVNADPQIGFALEIVQADVLARTWRAGGAEVFFNTGTDEHGQKIQEAAEKEGKDVQTFVDHYANEFRGLKDTLGLDTDIHFIRTTDPNHMVAAQEIWRRCLEKGDIEKRTFTGLYCVGCESFKTEKEIVDGHCVIHTNPQLQEITEENYFFKFSNYTKQLLAYLGKPDSIIPEWRRQEAIAFVNDGLEDFSISREKKRLSWGVPVPDDDTQVMYVWFDALTSYISTLGWPEDAEGNFQKFWEKGTTLQLAGKDQVRFQSIMWQAMLMSASIKNTDRIFYHGFINSGGQKMSKSLGNVISPYELVKKYGTDATRYILLRHINPMEDSDVTWERLDEWYTANLANGLGNLVARVMKLSETYNPSVNIFISPESGKIVDFKFNQALDEIWAEIKACDDFITTKEPFKLVKTNPEEGRRIIAETINSLQKIASMLHPFMPHTAEAITRAVRENKKPDNLFPRLPAQAGLDK